MATTGTTGIQAKYDPTNPNPYVAPAMPQPAPAMPSPLPNQGPQVDGAVRRSGAVATIADGMLRGFMQGRAMGQARQVMQLKKKSDDLQASYQQDAQRLIDLTNAGVGQDSDEYKRAKAAVSGSWGALMDFYGQHIEPQTTGKKKGVGGKVKAGLMEMFGSQDPMQVSQAWYQVARQAGPPVLSQVAMLNTPQAQAMRKTGDIQAQSNLQEANQVLRYQQVIAKPEAQWTEEDRNFVDQYNSLHGKASDELVRQKTIIAQKVINDPNYKLTPSEQQILNGGKPETLSQQLRYGKNEQTGVEEQWRVDAEGNEIAGTRRPLSTASTAPKPGTFGDYMLRRFGPNYQAEDELTGLKDWFHSRHLGMGGRGGAGSGMEKRYWDAAKYYHDLYPDMMPEEIDAMARRKTEGAGQQQAGQISHDAIQEPKQFDNDVISAAIDNMRRLPQYATMTTFDDALKNIVGQGDYGFQYHRKSDVGAPDKHGKYSGDVDENKLKQMERDLQNQIRVVLSSTKLTALPPNERRAVLNRMAPVFGPAAQGSGTPPASPQAHAATPTGAPSSAPPAGGQKKASKGVVRKSAFLKANPGATDADWKTIKPQLASQGYDVKDE